MQAIASVELSLDDRRGTNRRHTFVSSCPPTAAESAVAAARWERRGLLGRLIRVDHSSAGRR
jgi:hypothetical protein